MEVIGGEGSVSVSGAVEGYGEPLYFPTTDQALNLGIGADLRDMRGLMAAAARGDAVDWAGVTAIFEGGANQRRPDGSIRTLASLAATAPASAFPGSDPRFIEAIIRGGLSATGRGAGLSDNARRQLVDKGVQVLMYGLALERLSVAESRVASGDNAVEAVDEAWAILSGARDETTGSPNSGLLATALGREEDFQFQGRLARPLESSLLATAAAAERRNGAAFQRELAACRGYLNTILYLSVLRYANALEADQRASDREFHLAEGWTFFQALRPMVSRATPAGANAIESAYTRPPADEFPRSLTVNIYGAMNHPSVLRDLGIPEEFRVVGPPP